MEACGVDVLISAPQKGWSSSPCAALVMLVLDVHSFWIGQTLFIGGMLAGVVSIGVKLFAYRGEV